MELHSINQDQHLYVMPSGDGYSCYGFEVLDRKARAVLQWMGVDVRSMPPLGTPEHFAACSRAMDEGARYAARTGERCKADLTPELIGLEGNRVEVEYPDGTKTRFWVSRSTGWMPVHLEIKRRDSTGGGPVYFPKGATVRVVNSARR